MSLMTTRPSNHARRRPTKSRRRGAWRRGVALLPLLLLSWGADAATRLELPFESLVDRSGTIFRGRCIAREIAEVPIGGGRFATTRYTFEVDEYLKGDGPPTLTFSQIGTPQRGPLDLGALAGLPVSDVGHEYELMLLPEGSAGLTSPAGAGDGAFAVERGRLRPLRARGDGFGFASSRELRQAIVDHGRRRR